MYKRQVKDRAALALIRDAEEKKLITKGGIIVEGTAGNTGIGLAVIAFGMLATEILKVINAQKEFNRVLEEGSVAQTKALIEETEEKIKRPNIHRIMSYTYTKKF